jgi:hypothetical protein
VHIVLRIGHGIGVAVSRDVANLVFQGAAFATRLAKALGMRA